MCCHLQLAELREFMQAKSIPKQLRIKIRRYMETLYEQKSGFDEQQILRELPPAMAQELLNFMYVTSIHALICPGRLCTSPGARPPLFPRKMFPKPVLQLQVPQRYQGRAFLPSA